MTIIGKKMTKPYSFWSLPLLDKTLLSLVAILPWTTFLGVFGSNILHIPGTSFIKEGLLMIFIGLLVAGYHKRTLRPKLDIIDAIAGAFMAWMLIISFINNSSLSAYIFGGRYDFEWIIALLAAKHAVPLMKISFQHILKVFFWSAGIALAL